MLSKRVLSIIVGALEQCQAEYSNAERWAAGELSSLEVELEIVNFGIKLDNHNVLEIQTQTTVREGGSGRLIEGFGGENPKFDRWEIMIAPKEVSA